MKQFRCRRIYDPAQESDGYRVLVDRLWPRGLSRADARIDAWARELAPSHELRKWFAHDPESWAEFCKAYADELNLQKTEIAELVKSTDSQTVTLLYAAKDTRHNNAVALKEILQQYCRNQART